MKTKRIAFIISLAVFSVCDLPVTNAFAQGTAFTYQGRLNAGVNGANGSYDVRFAIFDALALGNQQGPIITNSATAVSNGLFTVTLDFGNQFPGANRWLEIAVRTNGGTAFLTLAPRQPLTPAPYAVFAATAGSATTVAGASNQTVSFTANGQTVLRISSVIDPNFGIGGLPVVNVVGGYGGSAIYTANTISNGVVGGFIGGGGQPGGPNVVGADYGSVVGGVFNRANGYFAFVGGGDGNTASGSISTVGGGEFNLASGGAATIPGGSFCSATANYSFAAGRRAKAVHQGAFVWCDSLDQDGLSQAANSFTVRASGGFFLFTSAGATGVQVGAGGGSWSSISDRNVKENFQPVNAQDVLARVAAMPLTTWNYRTQEKTIRHLGPMAQDFYAAFNVGEDDRHITTVDADGVALAAIQGLNEKLEQKETEITELKQRLEALEQLIHHQK